LIAIPWVKVLKVLELPHFVEMSKERTQGLHERLIPREGDKKKKIYINLQSLLQDCSNVG
jgi:hypothetical protein